MFNRTKSGLYALVMLILVSCGKEKSIDTLGTTGNPTTSTGVLKMTINGKPWVADKFAAASILQGVTAIYGMSYDHKSFIISLTGTTTGEYQLDQNSFHAAAWTDSTETSSNAYTTNQGNSLADAGGKVFVTRIDDVKKTVSGTFQFKMYRDLDNGQKTVIDGVFENISFGTASGNPGSGTGGTGGTGGSTSGNSISVVVDGSSYSATQVVGIVNLGKLIISGSDAAGTKAVGFQLPPDISTGTYDLSPFGDYLGLYTEPSAGAFSSESGKLTITEHDKTAKRIRGTFAFKAVNPLSQASKQLTAGTFTVKY